MKTNTPRTDASEEAMGLHSMVVPNEICRQIERELAASQAALDQMTEDAVKLKTDVERLQSQLKRSVEIAEKALDCLIPVFRGEHEEIEAELKQLKETIK